MSLKNLLGSFSLASLLSACSGTPPSDLGPRESGLKPCPGTPNCVCSCADNRDEEHYIAPLKATVSNPISTLWSRLPAVLEDLDMDITVREPTYLRAEATSKVLRFVDDVEFLLEEKQKRIQVRSASRLGHSDFGVNRKRIEKVRSALGADR